METRFKFNSHVCTDKDQSERLLALGLKKETADMCLPAAIAGRGLIEYYGPIALTERVNASEWDILTWSLGRLIEMIPQIIDIHDFVLFHTFAGYINNDYHIKAGFNGTLFDACISCIEWLIKEGYFNKEYLENGSFK